MARETSNSVRLGAFVTLGILLFTIGVYYIGNRKNLFGDRYHLSTLVQNANGLQVGNNVRYVGIVVGSVESIDFLSDTILKVNMVLDGKVNEHIRQDAVASIGLDGLVGNVIVNISPGNGEQPPAKDGSIIAFYSRLDPNDMLNTLGNTNNNIALLSLKLLEITENLNNGHGTIPLLIRDTLMADHFSNTIKNLQMASENLVQLSHEMQQSLEYISKGKGTLGYLLQDENLPLQLEQFAMHLDSLFIGQTAPVIANLNQSAEDISEISHNLKSATQALNKGNGLATALLNDTVAAENLRQILVNLDEGTARFNENMEALKHNFLFRKYFKKKEKEKADKALK